MHACSGFVFLVRTPKYSLANASEMGTLQSPDYVSLFIDQSKAFDTVDHHILIQHLINIGFSD